MLELLLVLSTAVLQGATPVPITIAEADCVGGSFLGFGAEWDTASYGELKVAEEEFKLIRERVQWMKLAVARVMMLTKWVYRGEGTFDFESPEMQQLYRVLDCCEQEGISVLLTDWGCETWTKVPGLGKVDDPKYAAAIGSYMDHLIKVKGYSCIKYFILVNEPNYEVKDWERWKKGLLQVAAEFKARGLDKQVSFAGVDESNAPDWHRRAVDELRDTLGAYDRHKYANDADVRPGKLEEQFRTEWQYALDHDPNAAKKPFIVGEAGMNDFAQHPHSNLKINDFFYGLFMADYAVQVLRAGSSTVCAWQLDDNGHKGFQWGLWSDAPSGQQLRPWFYTWSILSRYLPPQSKIYAPKAANQDWRLLIAQAPQVSGNRSNWTICLVNRGETPVKTSVLLPSKAADSWKRFLYSKAERPQDNRGYARPQETFTLKSKEPLALECPGESMLLLTTLGW